MTYQISDSDRGHEVSKNFMGFRDRIATELFWRLSDGPIDLTAVFAAHASMWTRVNAYVALANAKPYKKNSKEMHASVDDMLAGMDRLDDEFRKVLQYVYARQNTPEIA